MCRCCIKQKRNFAPSIAVGIEYIYNYFGVQRDAIIS
jgi:hypothetical protein